MGTRQGKLPDHRRFTLATNIKGDSETRQKSGSAVQRETPNGVRGSISERANRHLGVPASSRNKMWHGQLNEAAAANLAQFETPAERFNAAASNRMSSQSDKTETGAVCNLTFS